MKNQNSEDCRNDDNRSARPLKEEEGRRNQALTLTERATQQLLHVKAPIFEKPQKRPLHPHPVVALHSFRPTTRMLATSPREDAVPCVLHQYRVISPFVVEPSTTTRGWWGEASETGVQGEVKVSRG